jgi:hypothetical protein
VVPSAVGRFKSKKKKGIEGIGTYRFSLFWYEGKERLAGWLYINMARGVFIRSFICSFVRSFFFGLDRLVSSWRVC